MAGTKLEICRKCWGTGLIHSGDETSTRSKTCEDCHGIGFVRVPQTNADRIRAMSDEELAEFLCGVFDDDYGGTSGKFINGTLIEEYDEDSIAEWLKQPADIRGKEYGN